MNDVEANILPGWREYKNLRIQFKGIGKKGEMRAMRQWETVFSEADRALLQKTGLGARQTFGAKPALLIIDVNWGFLGSRPTPVLEAVEEYRTSCGEAGWLALSSIQKLLGACRRKGVPVAFTTGDPILRQFFPSGAGKATLTTSRDTKADEFPEQLIPLPSELIIRKAKASAFFGTPLALCLQSMEIDSLLIAGATTSGCVRASVVDACSLGFRCFVVEECTFDRFGLSHLVSLFDMNAKYADVITLDEALKYLCEIKLI